MTHTVKPSAIKALRKGRRLCPDCKGYGEIRYWAGADFPGDRSGYFWSRCETCGGSGLEQPGEHERVVRQEEAFLAQRNGCTCSQPIAARFGLVTTHHPTCPLTRAPR